MGPTVARAALAMTLALLVSGCMSLRASLAIAAGGQVAYRGDVWAVPAEVAAPPDWDLCAEVGRWFPADARLEPLAEVDRVGCRVSGTAPAGELGRSRAEGRSGLIIVRGVDTFTFVWAPMPGGDVLVDELDLSVSFPGLVTEHTGNASVWLDTVRWQDPADLFSLSGIMASGHARRDPVQDLLLPVILVAGAALLALSVRGVRRRAARRRAVPPVPASRGGGDAEAGHGTESDPIGPSSSPADDSQWAPHS